MHALGAYWLSFTSLGCTHYEHVLKLVVHASISLGRDIFQVCRQVCQPQGN